MLESGLEIIESDDDGIWILFGMLYNTMQAVFGIWCQQSEAIFVRLKRRFVHICLSRSYFGRAILKIHA